jgi:hypothetical protein
MFGFKQMGSATYIGFGGSYYNGNVTFFMKNNDGTLTSKSTNASTLTISSWELWTLSYA